MRRPHSLPTAAAIVLALAPAASAAISFVPAEAGLPATNAGFDCSPFNPGGWTGVAFADVDGDGDDDLGAVGRLLDGSHIFLSAGDGTWTESSTRPDADCHGRTDVDFADIDGDGDLDFGTVSGVNGSPSAFRNEGSTWTPVNAGLTGGNGEGFTFGDFDGDGNRDLATVGHFSGGTRAWFGDGQGSCTERSTGLEPALGGHRAAAGDVDGDCRDELVGTQFLTFDPLQDGVRVWKYDPASSTWQALASWYFDQPYGVAVADANRDGWNDVIVAAAQDVVGTRGSVHVFANQGPGLGFVETSTGLPAADAYYGDMAAGDLDNDGDLDIVTGDWGGVMRVFAGDGMGGWTEVTSGSGLGSLGDKIEGVGIGDLDGDCRLDVAVAAYRGGIRAYRGDAVPPCAILAEAGPSKVICPGAYTLDGSASRVCGCAGVVVYRWWEGATLLRDWEADPAVTVAPGATTLYRLDVGCSGTTLCFVSDAVTLAVGGGGSAPPALGNVLRPVKRLPDAVRFAWTDLPVPTGDYEVLGLEAALGPPTQAAFDGPQASVVATAPPGTEQAIAPGLLPDPPDLVFLRVRATGECGGVKGPA